jgi:O-antigen/teichoic acid export membrane protein
MISSNFLKSSFVYTLGGALPMLASIVLLPFYTNYLSPLHFLQVGFYISISLLFQIFFTFSLDTYFGVKYTQLHEQPDRQKEFIGTTAYLLLLLGVFWLLVTALSGPFLMKAIFREDYEMNFWPYGFYSVFTAFFNSYFKTATNCLIYLKKPLLFLGLNIINMVATLTISIGGLFWFPDSIVGPMYGRFLSGIIIFLLAHAVYSRYGVFRFNKNYLPDIYRFCFPFLFYVLSGWVLSGIDRFMLQQYIDKVDLNTYDLALKCFFGIEFLQNSLSAIIFPKIYEIWSKQKIHSTTAESNRYFNVFTVVNIGQLIAFCILLPLVYKLIITTSSFHEASAYIGILATGYAFRSILNFYLSTILFTRNTKLLLKIFGITAILQIVITYFTSQYFGLMGVIFTGIAVRFLQVLLSAMFTKGIFRYEFNFFKIYALPMIYVAMNLLQHQFFPEYNVNLYLMQLLMFSAVVYLLFKKEIRQVLIQFRVMKD